MQTNDDKMPFISSNLPTFMFKQGLQNTTKGDSRNYLNSKV